MPLISEEPQIPESAQGPRVTPAAGRTAPTPRPVPGPRSAATPRPGPARPAPPAQRAHPAPVAPAAPAPAPAAPARPEPAENRSAPQIQLIPAPAAGALDAAEEAVDLLLESGRAPGDILVLTTGEQHPWAAHELSFGEAAYWAQHDAGDDVFFADVSAADRARSRPVVVVAVNGDTDRTVARTLPVARDRAAALLIVCGDPQTINSALGAGV
ncbi:pyruvate/2-oxoglutarate dehydrogenase complex dihydrolipoamide acyltransferase (E2) component [Streptomyces sp. HB372]|nr:pyruvate/2-oxoglutarate dehydrogenase complex dihydrolipoamide acyltransferase (E2) component [Streptomyces sp. HB372]